MTSQMIVRVDPAFKKKFSTLAKTEGKSASEVVRDLMDQYIRNRDIGAYVDDLWNKIGNDLRKKKVTPSKIEAAIRNSRVKK